MRYLTNHQVIASHRQEGSYAAFDSGHLVCRSSDLRKYMAFAKRLCTTSTKVLPLFTTSTLPQCRTVLQVNGFGSTDAIASDEKMTAAIAMLFKRQFDLKG